MRKLLLLALVWLCVTNAQAQTTLTVQVYNGVCCPSLSGLQILVQNTSPCSILPSVVTIPIPACSTTVTYTMGVGLFVAYPATTWVFLGANVIGMCPGYTQIGVNGTLCPMPAMITSFGCRVKCQEEAAWQVNGGIASLVID